MKSLFKYLMVALLFTSLAFSQGGSTTTIRTGASLPSGAAQWSVFILTSGATGLYQCNNSPTCTSASQWYYYGYVPAPPTTPNGETFSLTETPNGSGAQPLAWQGPGLPGRQVTTGSTDTLLFTDAGHFVVYNDGATAVALTVPQAGSTNFTGKLAFPLANTGTANVTLTTTTSTINGSGSTATMYPGTSCTLHSIDDANWLFRCVPLLSSSDVLQVAVIPALPESGITSLVSDLAAKGVGSVTSVGSGTGLTGGPITGSGSLSLANTAVSAGSYLVAGFTVNAQGQLTAASGGTSHSLFGLLACGDTSASGTAQVCNTAPTFVPASGDCVLYTTTTANTGASLTLNVNSLGVKSVAKWQGATTLSANDVLASKQVLACYDGTNWELSTIGNAPGGSGTVTSVGFTINSTSPSGIFTVTGSPVTGSGTLNVNILGSSGGHPYFSSTTALSSTGAGTTHGLWLAQGAGNADTTTGAGTANQTLVSVGSSADPVYKSVSDLTTTEFVAGGGTAQAQTVTLAPPATALTAGLTVRWVPVAANTAAAPTLAVNGLTATAVTKCGSTALVAGDLALTEVATATYDGTQFQLLNPQKATCGAVTSVATGTGLTGGTITSSGTLSIATTGVAAATYTNPSVTLNTQGQATAASNGTAHTIGVASVCADTSASGTAQVCNTAPTFTPVANDCVQYTTTTANTGTGLTINVNSLGAKSVAKWGTTTTLAANDIRANTTVQACYDGTNWEVNDIDNSPGGAGTVTSVGVNGTANQVIVSGTSPITGSGTLTLSLSAAVQLGTDGTTAGTVQLSNGASAAHTILGSGATTTNTVNFFATVPTTGHLVDCTVTTTTCLFHDSGVVTANVVSATAPGVGICHFAGSTQNCTSSLIVAADITASTITGSQIASGIALAGSPTTTTQACTDSSTKIATTAFAQCPVNLATGTTVTLTAPSEVYVCTAACTVTVPVPAAGFQFCVMNGDNVATVITLAAIGTSARYENTARTAYGTAGTGTFVSGGAVKDMVCLVGLDSTHYLTSNSTGTWTAN